MDYILILRAFSKFSERDAEARRKIHSDYQDLPTDYRCIRLELLRYRSLEGVLESLMFC
jgi:hypothetical protein